MARGKLSAEKLERRHEIIRHFRETKKNRPATAIEIADWALNNGLWRPHPVDLRKQLAEELSRAMRDEYFTDPQGRRVRANHAAREEVDGEARTLWADMRDKSPRTRKHMEIACQNRRNGIVGDCRQLKTDIDSYNENYNPGEPIQYCFDFTDDLAELELGDKLGDEDAA